MASFRSEKMGSYVLLLQRESAWDILNEIGEMDAIHFEDYDPEGLFCFIKKFTIT